MRCKETCLQAGKKLYVILVKFMVTIWCLISGLFQRSKWSAAELTLYTYIIIDAVQPINRFINIVITILLANSHRYFMFISYHFMFIINKLHRFIMRALKLMDSRRLWAD